ncbi:GNAT family N-acetyltransferase [Clostridium isatidis]|uniref:GNAT family N-acetyltransferase n=1 Tax=Clostridium isatidis TaxID=182773 RepID=A0A343J9W5_9CLOT|nr:GNAT family N-acetyltransferase [Clostridium isatidis]ASW42323.1 GNAT family N-acetyltransferase [Clostridium isatidis]
MNIRIQNTCENIDWNEVRNLLKSAGMSYVDTETHKNSFLNSASVVFLFNGDLLIGMGRAISDKVRHGAIYDVAIDPNYQGKGLGKIIIETILKSLPKCNFILYASPGKEGFYEKLGFRKLKTGMGYFIDSARMKSKGFIE